MKKCTKSHIQSSSNGVHCLLLPTQSKCDHLSPHQKSKTRRAKLPFLSLVCSFVHAPTPASNTQTCPSSLPRYSLQRHYHPIELDEPPGPPHTSPQSHTSRLNGGELALDHFPEPQRYNASAFIHSAHLPFASCLPNLRFSSSL